MKRLFLLAGILIGFSAAAQQCFSVRYFGLTIHPFGDDLAKVQPFRLDKRAYFVANFGGFLAYEKYFFDDLVSVKLMQAFFTDCSAGPAGFTHLGLRGQVFRKGNHKIMLGFGPVLFYRRSWARFPDYVDGGVFCRYHSRHFGDIQYKFFWYGAEVEYDWKINEHFDLNTGFTPGVPLVMSLSVGLKYWPGRSFVPKEIYFHPLRHRREPPDPVIPE